MSTVGYRRIAAIHNHRLDEHGAPIETHSRLTVVAVATVRRVTVHFTVPGVSVEGVVGCGAGTVRPYAHQPGVSVADLTLSTSLRPGEHTTIGYTTYYASSEPPRDEFRMYTGDDGLDALVVGVEFKGECPPRSAHWAEWASAELADGPIDQDKSDWDFRELKPFIPTFKGPHRVAISHRWEPAPPHKFYGMVWSRWPVESLEPTTAA